MNLQEYQKWVNKVAEPGCNNFPITYPISGLGTEVGELEAHMEKFFRRGKAYDFDALKLELGDVMWYVAKLANDLNVDLLDVIDLNVLKLEDRLANGKRDIPTSI